MYSLCAKVRMYLREIPQRIVDKQKNIFYDISIREIQTNVHLVHSGSFCQIFLTQQSNMAGTGITK